MKNVEIIQLTEIITNPNQPRKHFDEESIEELAQSIKSEGLMSPIMVRPLNGKYEIVQGERRFRAATIAGLTEISVFVKELDDSEAFHLAFMENLQREDMTPLEEAQALGRYIEQGFTQEQIAIKISKSRDYVANRLHLLNLIPEVQDMIARKQITGSHIKPIMKLKNQVARLMGEDKAFELVQLKFYHEHKDKAKITVKELSDWGSNLRQYYLTGIIGVFNGYGEREAGSQNFAGVSFKVTLIDLCRKYDLRMEKVTREDIHFMLQMVLNKIPKEVKRSEVYKTYEDLEEYIFDSDVEVSDVWERRNMSRKPLKDMTSNERLAEHEKVIKENFDTLKSTAEEKGRTVEELLRDLDYVLANGNV